MEKKKRELVVEIPDDIKDIIAGKITEQVKESYTWEVSRAISEAINKKLSEDGFCDRVAEAVLDKVKMSEDEYTREITTKIKSSLLECVGTITSTTIKAVSEKIKSYGFIKIGDRY